MAVVASALALLLVWSYYRPVSDLVYRWWNDPDYVYGFLVPVFSGYLLWTRRGMLDKADWAGSWWGLALLGLAAGMRWFAAYFYYPEIDPVSSAPMPFTSGRITQPPELPAAWATLWPTSKSTTT